MQVNQSTESIWRVQVPEVELTASQYWVFRFLPSRTTFSETAASVSSPGFRIINSTAARSASSTTSAISSSTSLQTQVSSASASPTATTITINQEPAPETLSAGAKAGIAIGAAIVAILLVVSGWILARRRKTSRLPQSLPVSDHDAGTYPEVVSASKADNLRIPRSASGGGTLLQPSELEHTHRESRGIRAELG